MQFKTFHNDYFGAKNGAFSRVTEREHYDSQITLTDVEADLVINHFGRNNILIGNSKSNPVAAKKQFLLFPNLTPVELNLVFPKALKPELRLYIASTRGFKPLANDIWFIYETRDNDLVIGSLPEKIWNDLGQTDSIDEEYQDQIEATLSSPVDLNVSKFGKIATVIKGDQLVYVRDPKIAILRLKAVNYKCEIDDMHTTFTSQKSKCQYMEAHHFIPMKYQQHFETPLDNFDNIVSLCPNCHRGIHHAIIDHKNELIAKLYLKRPELHESYSQDFIAQFYNTIKVPITK